MGETDRRYARLVSAPFHGEEVETMFLIPGWILQSSFCRLHKKGLDPPLAVIRSKRRYRCDCQRHEGVRSGNWIRLNLPRFAAESPGPR